MRIRKLRHWTHANADWFKALDAKCFLPTDAPLLNSHNYHWWVITAEDGNAIGYAGLHTEGKDVRFCRAGVLKSCRGQGFQKDLIRVRLKWAKAHGFRRARTYTDHNNHASIKSLKTCGFRMRRLPEYNTFTIALTA